MADGLGTHQYIRYAQEIPAGAYCKVSGIVMEPSQDLRVKTEYGSNLTYIAMGVLINSSGVSSPVNSGCSGISDWTNLVSTGTGEQAYLILHVMNRDSSNLSFSCGVTVDNAVGGGGGA